MSNTIKIAIGVVLALLVALYSKAYKAARQLGFAVGSVTGLNIKGGTLSWNQGIKITNGDLLSIPIRAANVRNYINGQELGTSILKESQTIAGSGVTELIFYVSIPTLDLYKLGLSAINIFKTGKFSIRFVGDLNSLFLNIPIDQSFAIDFKQTLNI